MVDDVHKAVCTHSVANLWREGLSSFGRARFREVDYREVSPFHCRHMKSAMGKCKTIWSTYALLLSVEPGHSVVRKGLSCQALCSRGFGWLTRVGYAYEVAVRRSRQLQDWLCGRRVIYIHDRGSISSRFRSEQTAFESNDQRARGARHCADRHEFVSRGA